MASEGTDLSPRPPSPAAAVLLGIEAGLLLSLLTAVAESAASVALTLRHIEAEWPLRLAPAVLGQVLITHALLWCPLGVLLALAFRGRARSRAALLPPVCLVLLLLLAVVAVPADLDLALQGPRRAVVAGAIAGAGIVSLGLFAALRRGAQRGEGRGVERLFRFGAGIAVLVGAVTLVALVRSPLFDPGRYRVPAAAPERGAGTGARPDVLWIVLDTARPDRMTCYDPSLTTTPFLDAWAESSIVCDQAVSNGIWTAPTHASMFTGLSVREHGVTFATPHLEGPFPTVAEKLRDEGWVTAAFSNNPVVSPATNLTRGFSRFHGVDHLLPVTRFSLQHLVQRWGLVPPLPWLDPDFGAAMTNWMIARWLDERKDGGEPAFLFVNYMEAHAPYTVPATFRRRYLSTVEMRRSYELREKAYGDLPRILNTRFNMEGGDFLPRSDRVLLRKQYDATLRYLDERVRELIRMYEERGLLENTVVIVCSDHGEYLDDHGLWGHEFLTYNELSRVLLMLREPGRDTPLRIATPVQASELHDAVLAAALGGPGGLAAGDPAGRESRVAVTEFTGPWPRRVAKIRELDDPRLTHLMHPQVAVQDRAFKLMVSTDGTSELYDLSAGPEEESVLERFPEERDRLASWVRDWSESVARFRPESGDSAPGMDADTVKRLEALGYLGN